MLTCWYTRNQVLTVRIRFSKMQIFQNWECKAPPNLRLCVYYGPVCVPVCTGFEHGVKSFRTQQTTTADVYYIYFNEGASLHSSSFGHAHARYTRLSFSHARTHTLTEFVIIIILILSKLYTHLHIPTYYTHSHTHISNVYI